VIKDRETKKEVLILLSLHWPPARSFARCGFGFGQASFVPVGTLREGGQSNNGNPCRVSINELGFPEMHKSSGHGVGFSANTPPPVNLRASGHFTNAVLPAVTLRFAQMTVAPN
jgi:hypothetical protein